MALKPDSDLWNYFTNIVEEGFVECNICKQRLKNNRIYNLEKHLKKVHRKRTEIEKYFDVNVLENRAMCKTCGRSLIYRLCNLRAHMRKIHNIGVKLKDGRPSYQFPIRPYDEQQIKAVLNLAKRKMTQDDVNKYKLAPHWLFIKMDKKTVIRSVIGLIVEDCVPLHLFSSKHIEAFLNPMCEALSDKGDIFKVNEIELQKIISLISNYIRNDFSNDLHCRLLSIKINTDLNAAPNTFCISAQFTNDENIQKRVLGIIKLEDDGQLEEDNIKQILYKFNIDSNQIISASWDNTKPKYNKQVGNSEYLNEIDQFGLTPDIFLGDVKIEPFLGSTAQLCLLDIFKNSTIFQKFLQCRNMAKFVSDESNGYYQLFELNNLNIPQLDSPWKAGSTYKMMNDLHEAQKFLKHIKCEKFENPEDYFNIDDELWLFIEAFCKATNYLQKSITKFYTEDLHIGDFYAQWLKCKLLTEKLLSATLLVATNDILCVMVTQVLKAIEYRTKYLLNQDRFAACLYLDPRFQSILNSSQKTSAVEYLKRLWCRAKLYVDDDSESNEDATQLFDDDGDTFLNEFLSHDLQTKDKGSSDIFQKIEQLELSFQLVETNILTFWKAREKTDPEIHTLSKICFAIPATEIYNKMHYYDFYCLDDDSELSVYTKENLLNIRINAHLLDDAFAFLQLTSDGASIASALSDIEPESYDISENEGSDTLYTTTTTTLPVSLLPSTSAEVQSSSTVVSLDELSNGEFI